MAVTVTNQSNPLGAKLVQDTAASNTAVDNTTGANGTLYAVEIVNGAPTIVYLKLSNSADATAGTTAGDVVLMCAASSTQNYVFPSGIVFSSGFSHWCVTGAAESNTGAPGGSGVTVRYVTS
jgi:hypothetical protein